MNTLYHETRVSVRAAGVLLAALLGGSSVLRGADVEHAAMKAAVVPAANVYFVSDAAAGKNAPIQQKIKALQEEFAGADVLQNRGVLMQKRLEQLLEALGVDEEDLAGMVFSLSLEGMPLDRAPDLNQLKGLLAFALEKKVTVENIKLAVNRMAAETGQDWLYDQAEYRGVPTLSLVSAAEAENPNLPREVLLALPAAGEVVFMGMEDAVKAALDRLADSSPAPFTPALQAARQSVAAGAQSYLLFVPTDEIRSKLSAAGQGAAQQNPMMASAVQALGGMKHLVYSAQAGEALDMSIGGDFANAQQAIQMKSFLDMTVLGMGKMMLMQAMGKSIPMLESLKSTQSNSSAKLDFTLTEVDIRAFLELQAAGGLPFGPGGAPPAMPGMPVPGN